MESDRELLELAAKAAGFGLPGPNDHDGIGRQYVDSLGLWVKFRWGWDWFNPLNDDGDEARLEAALGLEVNWHGNFVSVGGYYEDYRSFDGDKQKARKMAGIRAAAEFGKTIDQVGSKCFDGGQASKPLL